MAKPGVYQTTKKDGSTYYRVSITFRGKHISLGSYPDEQQAALAYEEANLILRDGIYQLENFGAVHALSLEKFVILLNFRDHGIYFKTPIYLYPRHFEYHLSEDKVLKFDRDDLFFYASHKIMSRNQRLFYCDYGNQYGILTRYGLKNYAVAGRDFIFVNGDCNDYRYANIQVINRYMGVLETQIQGHVRYQVLIHVNGNYQVGIYDTEEVAAIAYNKATHILNQNGIHKNYIRNYITGMSGSEYQRLFDSVDISPKIHSLRAEDLPR